MDLVGKKINFKLQEQSSTEQDTPVLLSFPTGVPTDVGHADLSLWRKKSGNKIKQTLTCESKGVLYRGLDYGSCGVSSDALKYAIGIYNKSTQTMTLVPAHHPFAMSRIPTNEASSSGVSNMTAWERRAALTEEFGSRKRKRAAKAAESNIISIENISGAAAVEENITERLNAKERASIIPAAQVALNDQRLQLLPTFNEYATEPAEAYPLDALIPANIRDRLIDLYGAIVDQIAADSIVLEDKNDWISRFLPNCSGEFVASLVPDNIVHGMSKHKKSTKSRACELLYLDILINFYIAVNSSATVKKEDILSKYSMPADILDFVAQNFAVIKKSSKFDIYQRNKQYSQKTLLAVFAIGLHLGNYELNLSNIAIDLKSTVAAMQILARSLGCFTVKRKIDGVEISVAELKLPLKFPEPSKGKK